MVILDFEPVNSYGLFAFAKLFSFPVDVEKLEEANLQAQMHAPTENMLRKYLQKS